MAWHYTWYYYLIIKINHKKKKDGRDNSSKN
jgi:hypothetical protein